MTPYNILKPEVLGVVLVAFIPTVSQNGLNLVFLLVLDIGINIISRIDCFVLVEFFKVLDVIYVVGYLDASARDSDIFSGLAGLFFALMRTRAILRVRIRRGRDASGH